MALREAALAKNRRRAMNVAGLAAETAWVGARTTPPNSRQYPFGDIPAA
jgi:hypothetical protein